MAELSLWLASQTGRCRAVEATSPENFGQKKLRDALHVAVANNHAAVVCILLRAGAVFDGICNPVFTALRYDSADALLTLVEAKASIIGTGDNSRYIVIAAIHGATKCLQVLILAKAVVTSEDCFGQTPLCEAAARGWVDTVQVLVQAKADIDARHNGYTPVLKASAYGHVIVLQLLIRAKADATRCTAYSNASPLLLAAAGGHAAVVRCLLAHVPTITAVATRRDNTHCCVTILSRSTPLDVARQFQHDDVILLLVAATARQ